MRQGALLPGSTIGILGGGQLGRMLSLAAARLGLKCHIYCPEDGAPAFDVAAAHTVAAYDDTQALLAFARACDAVTFEFENIPAESLEQIAAETRVAPGASSLRYTQDRLTEKNFLTGLGIATAPFAAVEDDASLGRALDTIGRPSILKTRTLGYDGKGQAAVREDTKAQDALAVLKGAPAILEGFIHFEKEISAVVTRAQGGETVIYDIGENLHADHILKETKVPAAVPNAVCDEARAIAGKIADALDHVGTLAVEFFYCGTDADTPLLVNEIAPRVHNSGHWTIDACLVSQFENHMRAVAGWPIGTAARHSDAVMTNLIGEDAADWQRLAGEDTALHLYGKAEIRAGRKMGHVTRISRKG